MLFRSQISVRGRAHRLLAPRSDPFRLIRAEFRQPQHLGSVHKHRPAYSLDHASRSFAQFSTQDSPVALRGIEKATILKSLGPRISYPATSPSCSVNPAYRGISVTASHGCPLAPCGTCLCTMHRQREVRVILLAGFVGHEVSVKMFYLRLND